MGTLTGFPWGFSEFPCPTPPPACCGWGLVAGFSSVPTHCDTGQEAHSASDPRWSKTTDRIGPGVFRFAPWSLRGNFRGDGKREQTLRPSLASWLVSMCSTGLETFYLQQGSAAKKRKEKRKALNSKSCIKYDLQGPLNITVSACRGYEQMRQRKAWCAGGWGALSSENKPVK